MEIQFKDQKNIRQQKEGLQVISSIQKMLTAVFISIGIMSMASIPMEANPKVKTDAIMNDTTIPIPNPAATKIATKMTKQQICRRYALDAVTLNHEAQKHQCTELKSPVWSNDHQKHFDWCMHGDNSKYIVNRNKERKASLESCKIKENTCRKYALDAVELNHEAQKYQCGFKPPVWSNNHQNHFDWCRHGDNSKYTVNANKKRKASLQTCKAKSANKPSAQSATQYCKIYAQDAINQFNASQQRGCGFFGSGWSLDYNVHFNWCFKTYKKGDLTVIANEMAKRNAMLINCK